MFAGRLAPRKVAVWLAGLPPDSALQRAMNPDNVWGLPEQLLALVADLLAVANWQRGQGKKADAPKPIPRPGVTPEGTKFGSGALPYDEMAEWLGWEPHNN